jgi:ribosomal-protein-alanine N-acetyltransferase
MKTHKIKHIQGSKILLEPFSHKFINDDYLAWMNDEDTTKFIQKAKKNTTLEDLNLFANKMIASEVDYFFAILLKKNLQHVGNVRLGPVDFKLMKSNFGIMIGSKNFRGCGVGTEVLNLIKEFSFGYLKLKQIIFPVVQEHVPAMRLYKKAGFVLQKNTLKKTFNKNGQTWKLVEWEMRNPNIREIDE